MKPGCFTDEVVFGFMCRGGGEVEGEEEKQEPSFSRKKGDPKVVRDVDFLSEAAKFWGKRRDIGRGAKRE